ncbi:MAG: hypothetical protein NUW00_04335 [Candidatus Kaiserbacteria bacterium]|nr:hypothetical protein [Candidatus Kaiserbacteria bacterium]
MGFENLGKESKKNTSIGKAALFASVLAFGMASDADATERDTQSFSDKEAIRQPASATPLSGSDIAFLRENFPAIDSSVLRWKASGYVPDAWESLSDADLCALITYINRVHSSTKVNSILSHDMAFGPIVSSKYLRSFVRKGVKEMIEMYKIPEAEISTMTWGNLALKTIYRIPKDPK